MKVFSIIIPVYNNQDYLAKCLNTIVSQYLASIEVIIVNDGSTDNSGDIAESYAIHYSFIKVIHQSNQGVSAARNRAIRESIGSYLIFLDSDDLLYKDFLQRILELIQNQPDIIEINADLINEIGLVSYKKIFSFDYVRSITASTDAAKLRLSKQAKYYLWSRIIRRELVDKLRFNEKISFCEDALYLTECYFRAKKIITVDESLYGYRKHDTNVTSANSISNIDQLTQLCKAVANKISNSQDKQYITFYLSLLINMIHLRKSMYTLEFKKINSDKVTVQHIREIKNCDEWSFFKLRHEISWLRRLSITAPKISNILILLKYYTRIPLIYIQKIKYYWQ